MNLKAELTGILHPDGAVGVIMTGYMDETVLYCVGHITDSDRR